MKQNASEPLLRQALDLVSERLGVPSAGIDGVATANMATVAAAVMATAAGGGQEAMAAADDAMRQVCEIVCSRMDE